MKKQVSMTELYLNDIPIGQRAYPSAQTNTNEPSPEITPGRGAPLVSDSEASFNTFGSDREQSLIPDRRDGALFHRHAHEHGKTDTEASSDVEFVSSNTPRVPSHGSGGRVAKCEASSDVEVIAGKSPHVLTPGPGGSPGAHGSPMRDLNVQYTFYLPKGTDITKGPPKKTTKLVYSNIPIPPTARSFDISNYSFNTLKDRLFRLASEIDKDTSGGNTAILRSADAGKHVKITCYIARHPNYGQNRLRPISNSDEVEEFFRAVLKVNTNNAGFIIAMDNPAKTAQEASDELTKSQARLVAQNKLNNVHTTAADLAHTTPIPAETKYLTELQDHHGSRINNKGEGWRIFNKRNLSQKMELTFRHFILWSKELAKGVPNVTLDDPPLYLQNDFAWVDVTYKRPSGLPTPNSAGKRVKMGDDNLPSVTFALGSYAEMQGLNITIEPKKLRMTEGHTSIRQYMRFCEIEDDDLDRFEKILSHHKINGYRFFLFPDVLNAQTVSSWGIPYGSTMLLFTRARDYYKLQVDIVEELAARRARLEADLKK